MAWLMSATADGFQPAALAQTIGGGLLLGATALLARLTGLSRGASFGAALLVLGLPNVVPQFTSAYTDLFTGGILAAGFALWLSALQRGRGSWLGGLAAGLAIGSKGTTAYIAPGLALVVGWLAWRHKASARAWWPTLVSAVLAVLVFAAPAAWRNLRAFGSPVGPKDFVELHHGITPGWRDSLQKLRLNLGSALAQLCEPNSQPPWAQAAARAAGEAIIRRMPTSDPFAFGEINRRENLEKVYGVTAPDADVASTGALLPCLGVAALVVAITRRKSADAQLILGWCVIVGVFVGFMHWRVQWNPYLYRFVTLAAPWMAVLAAWVLARLPPRLGLVGWTVVGATTACGFIGGTFNTHQAGWPAVTSPLESTGYYVYQQWRGWSQRLEPAGPLRPCLPVNAPLAAFYRTANEAAIESGKLSAHNEPTAQAAVRSAGAGWLIVPAAKWIGREGEVVAKTTLFRGDEQSAFSLAAYRALQPGEQAPPVLYRNRSTDTANGVRREMLVRTWSEAPLRIELINFGSAPREFEARSPMGAQKGRLGPGERRQIELRVPANFPTLITIDSDRPAEDRYGRLEAMLAP
jgi:4-amino-4-deoxy-L-arabinose transferase-like glycosyltransferase